MLALLDPCVEWSQEKLQNIHVKFQKLAFISAIIAYKMDFFFAIYNIYSFIL